MDIKTADASQRRAKAAGRAVATHLSPLGPSCDRVAPFLPNGGVQERSLVPKRSQPGVPDDAQTTKLKPAMPVSAAAKFNATVMRKLQKAIAKDPEVDLFTVFPSNYVSRLAGRKSQKGGRLLFPGVSHMSLIYFRK